MPKTSVFCKTNHALKSVFYKTNHACNKQFLQDKSCTEKPVFCNKVHTQMLQVSGRLFIPIHSIPVFSQFCKTIHTRFSNDLQYQSYPYTPVFCKTILTQILQSSARQFIPIQSSLLQGSSYPDSPIFCKTFHTQILQAY